MTAVRGMAPGYYVYDARRYLTALNAYSAGDYRRFDRIEDAESDSEHSDRRAIDRVTVRTVGQEVT
jgi:hypothetical protein